MLELWRQFSAYFRRFFIFQKSKRFACRRFWSGLLGFGLWIKRHLPQSIAIVIIVAALAVYAGSRFIFVEAYDNRAHIFPGSFTVKQEENALAWQTVSNSFYPDLDEQADIGDFNQSNSAHIVAPAAWEKEKEDYQTGSSSEGSESATTTKEAEAERTATSTGEFEQASSTDDHLSGSEEETGTASSSDSGSQDKEEASGGSSDGQEASDPDSGGSGSGQDEQEEDSGAETDGSSTEDTQENDAEDSGSSGTDSGESPAAETEESSQSTDDTTSDTGSAGPEAEENEDTSPEDSSTAEDGEVLGDTDSNNNTDGESSEDASADEEDSSDEEETSSSSDPSDTQETDNPTSSDDTSSGSDDKQDGSDKVSVFSSFSQGIASLFESLSGFGSLPFGFAQEEDMPASSSTSDSLTASTSQATTTDNRQNDAESNEPGAQSLIFSDFSVPPQYEQHELGQAKLKLSLAARGGGSSENLVISYKLDGEWKDWDKLKIYDPISNGSNNGYFGYKLPSSITWQEINDIQVRLAYKNQAGEIKSDSELEIYLDALWLEVDYKLQEIEQKKNKGQDPDKKMFGKQEVEFEYTDDNSGEDLIIKTDKKNYYGLTRSDVYFNVTNTGDERSVFGLQVYFPSDKGDTEKIYKWRENIEHEVQVPEFGSSTQRCESGWEPAGSGGEDSYHCASTSQEVICDKLSSQGGLCHQSNVKISERSETRTKSEWQAVHTVKNPLKDKRNFLERFLRLGPDRKNVPEGFRAKKSTEGDKHILEPGETAYFKMEINYDPYSDGEFFIEAIGEENGYGLLDPWWDTEYSYKRPVYFQYSGSQITNYQQLITLDTYSLATSGKMQADCDDIRFLDSGETASDELDYWIEPNTCNTTSTRVWVELPELSGNKTIYMYYGNASSTSVSNGSSTFVYFNDFETEVGFDSGSLNPTRTAASARYGAYGLEGNGSNSYYQEVRGGIPSGRNLIWESWVRGDPNSGNTSLAAITIGHPSAGAEEDGYQAYIDEKNGFGIRRDFSGRNPDPVCIDGAAVPDFNTWYFLTFRWLSDNSLTMEARNNPAEDSFAGCSGSDTTYTDGEYGVGLYKQGDWDNYRVRKYASSTVNFSLGEELDQSSNLTQIHYRWRDDDDYEASATWAADEDTRLNNIKQDENVRLRFEVSNEGNSLSSTTQYRLEYGVKNGSCADVSTWHTVPTNNSLDWQIANSSYIADGNDTTNVANGLTDENTTFVAGEIKDGGNTTSGLALDGDEFTEIEFNLKATYNANANYSYCFRLTDSGQPLNSYFIYPEAGLSVNWWDSWGYRQPADIYNPNGTTTDMQVRVDVDTASLISEGKLQADCGDLRFVDTDQETQLNYWINEGETATSCDATSTETWVKVPELKPGTSTIYIYYANPSATQGSDCVNTFMFCDDFNDGDAEGWTEVSGVWQATSSAYYQSSDTTSELYTVNGDSSWTDYILETDIKIMSGGSSGGIAGTVFRYEDAGDYYASLLDDNPNDSVLLRNYVNDNYNPNNPQEWTAPTIDRDTWLDLRTDIRANGTNDEIDIHYDGGVYSYTHTDNDHPNGGIGLMMDGTQAYYDNVRVRKYAASDFIGYTQNEQSAPSVEQAHTRWRMDDGNEVNAIWRGQEDENVNLNKGDTYRLRFNVYNNGDALAETTVFQLEYGLKVTNCDAVGDWKRVPTDTSRHWQITDSSYLTDGATTSNLAHGLTDLGSIWREGEIMETDNTSSAYEFGGREFTELEYVLKSTANANLNAEYCFRLTNSGVGLDNYREYGQGTLEITWWNSNWTYRQEVMISNNTNDNDLDGYQLLFEFDDSAEYGDFWQHVDENGDDIRFIASDDTTELDYWIQDWDYTASTADIWVQTDALPATSTEWIYMYYGNNGAAAESDMYEPFTYSGMKDIYYVVTNHNLTGATVDVVSLIDGNTVQLDSQTPVDLDRQGTASFSSPTRTSVLRVKGPVGVRLSGDAQDALVPISFADTQFSVPSDRANPEEYYIYSPFTDATTTLYNGSILVSGQTTHLSQGGAATMSYNVSPIGIVEATAPVLLSFQGGDYDAYAPYRATTRDLYGIQSRYTYVGAVTDGTSFDFYQTGSTTAWHVSGLNRGERVEWFDTSYGQGDAAANRIANATHPLGVIQQADADGGESTVFLPEMELASEYMLPTSAEYITVACPPKGATNTISIYDPAGSLVTSSDCTAASADHPAQVLFSAGTYNPGTRIDSDEDIPFYIYYEDNSLDDETNLWGAPQARQYTYPHPTDIRFYEAEFSQAPEYTQNYYRWYENVNGPSPSTAWGGRGENQAIGSGNSPPGQGDVLRLRMSVQLSNNFITANGQAFKLQYGKGSDCAAISSWHDVGTGTQSTIWKSYDNDVMPDNSPLNSSDLKLSVSDAAQSYEEDNPSRLNPRQINVGDDGEWDWVLRHNGAETDTDYCFRMVKANGALLDGYSNYAQLTTNARPNIPSLSMPFDNKKTSTTTPSFTFSTTDPQSDDLEYEFQWAEDYDFSASTTRSSDSDSGFVNSDSGGDTSPFASGNNIEYTIQAADALVDGTTYWWRVRARDPDGSGAWSEWSGKRSLTVDTSVTYTTWFQTKDEQFERGMLENVETSGSDSVQIRTVIGEYGKTTLDNDDWTEIELENEYDNLVVVASPRYFISASEGGEVQRTPRVDNKTSTSFEIKVDNYNDSLVSTTTVVDWVAMEAGTWTVDDGGSGLQVAAETVENVSGVFYRPSNINGSRSLVSFDPNFSGDPTVLHTVSSDNDTSWITSGVDDGSDTTNEPTQSGMGVMLMHIYGDGNHDPEDIDFVAFNQGSGTNNGVDFDAVNGTSVSACCSDSGYAASYHSGAFSSVPQVTVIGQIGHNGGDGGFAITHTGTPPDITNHYSSIDEDGPGADRGHMNEDVSILAFASSTGIIRGVGYTTGTATAPLIDYDWGEGVSSWGSFSWNDNEANGDIGYQIEYYDNGSWNLVPDGTLFGNSTGFDSPPINLSPLDTTTYNQIRPVANLTYSGGTPYLSDWTVSWDARALFEQKDFRWYENTDAISPTTAWNSVGENQSISASDAPPVDGDVLRLRMNMGVSFAALTAGSQRFKLEYGEGSNCGSIATWQEVGQTGSSTIWRGYDNASVSGGSTTPSVVLSTSDTAESYEEENDSVLNPNTILAGDAGEWDWVLENNGATRNTTYCFRMVKSDGLPFNTYARYPQVTINSAPDQPSLTSRLFDNEKTGDTTPTFEFSSNDNNNEDIAYEFQWSTDASFGSYTSRVSDTHAGFTNISSTTDTSPFNSGDSIEFTIQSGDSLSNNTTYWWRVRARDPGGSNTYGEWSNMRSFTVDTSVTQSTWHQATDEQFETGTLNGAKALSDSVIIDDRIGEYGTTSVSGEAATTVNLENTYNSLIVVAVPRYTGAHRAARVISKSSNSFDVKVDNADGELTGSDITVVDWMVMEEGSWTLEDGGSGLKVIAGTKNVSTVGYDGNWPDSEDVSFSPNFDNSPAVLHTVTSNNDSNWVASHVDDGSSNEVNEPTASGMGILLNLSMVGTSHDAEDVDYIAFDEGNGSNNGNVFAAVVSSDSVAGVANSPPYNVGYGGVFSSVPEVALSGQMGMDGTNGSWSLLYGSESTQSAYPAAVDEALPVGDSTRGHTTEVVGVVAFDAGGHGFITAQTPPDGYAFSTAVDFDDGSLSSGWGEVRWTDDETSGDIKYQVEYWTGSSWELVPDLNIPDNSIGIDSSPIDLSSLNTSTYNEIRLKANLSYSGGTPYLNDWTIEWAGNEKPVSNFNSAAQKTDGSGAIDISASFNDEEGMDSRGKVEYVSGSTCDFSSPNRAALSEADSDTTALIGDPDTENSNTYQIGNSSGWIDTSSTTDNVVNFDWNSAADIPGADGVYCLRLTANDQVEDQIVPATTTVAVDNVAPTQPGDLSEATSTNTSVTLSFGATSSDSHFDSYRIFYKKGTSGVTESDNQHIFDGASSTDYEGATSTVVQNLSANTDYVFNIWAYDIFGNQVSANEVVITTQASDNPPTGVFNSAAQRGDASGVVDISIEVDDPDNDDQVRAKLEFATGTDCNFASATSLTIDETDENTTADYYDPKVENDNEYQVGNSSGWIWTSPGSNTVNFDWLTQTDLPEAEGSYCVRLTVSDGQNDQVSPDTTIITVDNSDPSQPGALSEYAKTANSITLEFGSSSIESNFSEYRIYYKQGASMVAETDIEHDDPDLDYIDYNGTATTTVSGLQASTTYSFAIWAYDIFGNESVSQLTVITTNRIPEAPIGLSQYRRDASTTIPNGGWTNEDEVYLEAEAYDDDSGEVISLYFNLVENSDSFLTATSPPANPCASTTDYAACPSRVWQSASQPASYSTTSYQAMVNPHGLTAAYAEYKWQVMACDDAGDCSAWQDAGVDPNIRVDTVAPTAPGELVEIQSFATSSLVELTGTTTENNFSEYKVFYKKGSSGVTEDDFEHDDPSFDHILFSGATTTEVLNLAADTQYVMNIWAYDLAGNRASSTQKLVVQTSPSSYPPSAIINSLAQKTDGSGAVDISVEFDDPDNDDEVRAKLQYEPGVYSSCPTPSPQDSTLDETGENTTADYGDPVIENDDEFQVGTSTGWIWTSPGSNTVNFDWLSKADIPDANTTYTLCVTASDGSNQATSSPKLVLVDNLLQSGPGALTLAEKTANQARLRFGSQATDAREDRYRIFYKEGASGVTEQGTEHNDSNLLSFDYNGATSTLVTGLKPGTDYVFNIWAYDTRGNRASSTELAFTTNHIPTIATSLEQYQSDAVTVIPNGGWTGESEVSLYATTSDADAGDYPSLYFQVTDMNGSFQTASTIPSNACYSWADYSSCASKIWTTERPWIDESWSGRQKITIDSSMTTASQTDFPVLIHLTSSALSSGAQENGDDIVFTADDMQTRLDHEIESYASSTGELYAWVSLPDLSSSEDTEIYMYYGNPSAGNQENVSGVWSNDFTAVWHLNESPDGTLDEIGDSTGSGYDGTTYGSMDSSSQISAQVNGGLDFDGNDDYIALDMFYNGANALSQFTVCNWFNTTFSSGGWNDNWAFLDFDRSEYFDFYINADDGRLGFSTNASNGMDDFDGNTSSLNDGTWHYGCAVFDGTDKYLYVDGESDGTRSNPHNGDALGSATTRYGFIADGSEATSFNGAQNSFYYEGGIDDLHYSESIRDADWIKTSYNNQNDPDTYLTIDSEQSYAGYGSPLDNINISGLPDDYSGYKWQAMACDLTDCSDWSDFGPDPNFYVDTTPPGAPGQLSDYDVESFSITLEFGATAVEDNFSEYKIFYTQGTDAPTEQDIELIDNNLSFQDYNGTATTTVDGLEAYTDYTFNIWAYDEAGNKSSSTPVTIKTLYSVIDYIEYTNGTAAGWADSDNAWDLTNDTYAARAMSSDLDPDPENDLFGTENNATTSPKSVASVEVCLEGYVEEPESQVMYFIPYFTSTTTGATTTVFFDAADDDTCTFYDITDDPSAPAEWTWQDVIDMDMKVFGGNTADSALTSYVDKIKLRVISNSYPHNAADPEQYWDNGSVIPNGTWVDERIVKLGAQAIDPDTVETIYLYFEFIPNSQTFTQSDSEPRGACAPGTLYGNCSGNIWYVASSSTGDFSADPYAGTTTIAGIPDDSYKWQVLACDDDGACADWVVYNAATPNIKLDATPPPNLGPLTEHAKSSVDIEFAFGSSTTDTNFTEYKIFYREGSGDVTENDFEHDDPNLDYIDFNGASTTLVESLSADTEYTFNIWAYDEVGNKSSSTPISITTNESYNLSQISYLIENDDGTDVNSNTSPNSADTGITDVYKGQRMNVRIQIQNTGGDRTYERSYKLQYEKESDLGNWYDVGGASDISYSQGLSGSSGDTINTSKGSFNFYTWQNGHWYENTGAAVNYDLPKEQYTEFAFAVDTSEASEGETYNLRLYDTTGSSPLDSYTEYPSIAIMSDSTLRHSKGYSSSLPEDESDRPYYLDKPDYDNVSADDSSYSSITSSGYYPVHMFVTEHTNNTQAITGSWNGRSSVEPSTNPVYLQVFQFGSTNAWVTVDSNASASADTDFTLSGNINYHLSEYYDASNQTHWRIYQDAGSQILSTDQYSTAFSDPAPSAGMTHYRWRNDDGDEGSATWRVPEDEGDPANLNYGEHIRLRLAMANTGGGDASNYQYRIQYASSSGNCATDPGGWIDVPVDAAGSEHFEMATSSYFNNGDPTSGRLSEDGYTFVAGEMVKDPNNTSGSLTTPEDEYTEVEYNLMPTLNAGIGRTYCFRATDNGSDLDYYDIYAELTMGGVDNDPPSFTTQPSDGGSSTTTPTNYGEDVVFTSTASDPDGDNYYMAVCQTDDITAGNGGSPSCDYGSWCVSDIASSSDQATCTTTANIENWESRDWYAFVCDHHSGVGIAQCSLSSQGETGTASGSPFNINHAPEFTGVETINDNLDPGETFTIHATSTDSDSEGGNDTLTLYVCSSNSATYESGCSDETYCSSLNDASPNTSCTIDTEIPTAPGATNYYAFVYDSHGLAATANSRSSSYTIRNTPPTLGSLVLNENSPITLNLKGAPDTQVQTVMGSISDLNGCESLQSATAVVYMSSTTSSCDQDNNDCYRLGTSDCVKTGCASSTDLTAGFTCTADMKYFAIPTDDYGTNPYEPYHWESYIQIYDSNYHSTTSDGVQLNTGLGLEVVEDEIDFGTDMVVGTDTGDRNSTTTIENIANSPIDTHISGTDMSGNPSGTLTVDNIEWSTDNFTYTLGNDLTDLGEDVPIGIPRPVSEGGSSGQIYWGIGIPSDADASSYVGQNTFTVIQGSDGW